MEMKEWAQVILEGNEHTGSLSRDSNKKRTHTKNGAALGRLISGESDRRNELKNDGTPYAVKNASTVWSGGKGGDNLKALPIAINSEGYEGFVNQYSPVADSIYRYVVNHF